MSYTNFEEWKYEVDRLFRLRTRCTVRELGIDDIKLEIYFTDPTEPTPEQFVDYWIDKYGIADYSKY